jgi:hypothetical protein
MPPTSATTPSLSSMTTPDSIFVKLSDDQVADACWAKNEEFRQRR